MKKFCTRRARFCLAPFGFGRFRCGLWLFAFATARLAALDVQSQRSSPMDLEICGKLANAPAGASRFVRWSDLRALPTTKLTLSGEFVKGEQEVTVLFLADLWSQLPRADGVDTMLATCSDGYAAIYRQTFIAKFRPFLILEINGQGPEHWPPPGLKFNPAPYVISVAKEVVPEVSALLDPGHKKPWGVTKIELANFDERYHDALSGRWSKLSDRASAGREIWINSCASCHHGPATSFGGTKSDRPFEVLAAHAGYNQAYFKKYVRDPKSVMPSAKMEAHPHYADAQLDELMAFLTADGKE